MTIEIRYCVNSCTRRHGDETYPATTDGKSQLCNQCEDRLHDWLGKIPDNYALVPLFVEHGTTAGNPESKATKSSNAPAPMRLDAIDLLDTRRGRRWNGTEPTTDRRGVIGILQPWVEWLRDERPLSNVTSITVTSACELLDRHRLWVTEQDTIGDLYEDIRKLHRTLCDAIGDYRQKPVATCTTPTDDADECGGPLFPSALGGARCARCRREWSIDELARLALILTPAESA